MYREPCPNCSKPFPITGPKTVILNPTRIRATVHLQCPACSCALDRRMSRTETMTGLIGYSSLMVASVMSILDQMYVFQFEGTPWLALALYLVFIMSVAIQIGLGWSRQHYFVRPPDS